VARACSVVSHQTTCRSGRLLNSASSADTPPPARDPASHPDRGDRLEAVCEAPPEAATVLRQLLRVAETIRPHPHVGESRQVRCIARSSVPLRDRRANSRTQECQASRSAARRVVRPD
jgi:hypothetical protein